MKQVVAAAVMAGTLLHATPAKEPEPEPTKTSPEHTDGLGLQLWANIQKLKAIENLQLVAKVQGYQRQHSKIVMHSGNSTTGAVSGSCASMAPAGFPSYIVNRESGGDPNAYNSSSGAKGCAQILSSHFQSGGTCAGITYSACWNKLWTMSQRGEIPNPWACTVASGCAR